MATVATILKNFSKAAQKLLNKAPGHEKSEWKIYMIHTRLVYINSKATRRDDLEHFSKKKQGKVTIQKTIYADVLTQVMS